MKRYPLPITMAAVTLLAATAVPAQPPTPSAANYDLVLLKSSPTDKGLTVDAQLETRWGRAEASASALRADDGRVLGSARAWWRSDLPDLGTSLRLGSQQTTANFMRGAIDVMGFGVAGQLAPMLLDYALSVGRLEPSTDGTQASRGRPAGSAWLRRIIDGRTSIGVHALQAGGAREVGAVLDALHAWPGLERLGVVQHAGLGPAQRRLIADHRFEVRGAQLEARTERVMGTCVSAPGEMVAGIAMPSGCAALSAGGRFDVMPRWQLLVGSTYRQKVDESRTREASVAAAWLPTSGLQVNFSVKRNDSLLGSQHALGATLSHSFGAASGEARRLAERGARPLGTAF